MIVPTLIPCNSLFSTFSLRWLPQWLCELYQNQEGVRKFYNENALLAAATSGCRALFWAAVQSLRPLSTLDLQLSLSSILNHHDVSCGAFPAANALSTGLSSPASRSGLSPAASSHQPQLLSPQKKDNKQLLSPQSAATTPHSGNSDGSIEMEEVVLKSSPPVPPKQQSSAPNSGARKSGIPSASKDTNKVGVTKVLPSNSNSSPPKSAKLSRHKQTPTEEVTVEKAQPVTVTPSIHEPKAASSNSSSSGSSVFRNRNKTTAPSTTPSAPSGLVQPPTTPATTPLSGNRVRMPSSTPIFQRGASDTKSSGKSTPLERARATGSPATVMGNSNNSGSSSTHRHHHKANMSTNSSETPASVNNVTASSSSGSAASPSSRRRPGTRRV